MWPRLPATDSSNQRLLQAMPAATEGQRAMWGTAGPACRFVLLGPSPRSSWFQSSIPLNGRGCCIPSSRLVLARFTGETTDHRPQTGLAQKTLGDIEQPKRRCPTTAKRHAPLTLLMAHLQRPRREHESFSRGVKPCDEVGYKNPMRTRILSKISRGLNLRCCAVLLRRTRPDVQSLPGKGAQHVKRERNKQTITIE